MSKSMRLKSIKRNKKLKEKHLEGNLTYIELNSLIVLQKQRGHDFKKEALTKATHLNAPDLKNGISISGACRCCFRKFFSQERRIKITPTHADRFNELTNVKLSLEPTYPQYICELCDLDLVNFSCLRKSFISKQELLYDQSRDCVKRAEVLTAEAEPFEIADTTLIKGENGFEESFLLVSPVVFPSAVSSPTTFSEDVLDVSNIKKEPELIIDDTDYEACEAEEEKQQPKIKVALSEDPKRKRKHSEMNKKALKNQEAKLFCFHCGNFFWNLKKHLTNVANDKSTSECGNSKQSEYSTDQVSRIRKKWL